MWSACCSYVSIDIDRAELAQFVRGRWKSVVSVSRCVVAVVVVIVGAPRISWRDMLPLPSHPFSAAAAGECEEGLSPINLHWKVICPWLVAASDR